MKAPIVPELQKLRLAIERHAGISNEPMLKMGFLMNGISTINHVHLMNRLNATVDRLVSKSDNWKLPRGFKSDINISKGDVSVNYDLRKYSAPHAMIVRCPYSMVDFYGEILLMPDVWNFDGVPSQLVHHLKFIPFDLKHDTAGPEFMAKAIKSTLIKEESMASVRFKGLSFTHGFDAVGNFIIHSCPAVQSVEPGIGAGAEVNGIWTLLCPTTVVSEVEKFVDTKLETLLVSQCDKAGLNSEKIPFKRIHKRVVHCHINDDMRSSLSTILLDDGDTSAFSSVTSATRSTPAPSAWTRGARLKTNMAQQGKPVSSVLGIPQGTASTTSMSEMVSDSESRLSVLIKDQEKRLADFRKVMADDATERGKYKNTIESLVETLASRINEVEDAMEEIRSTNTQILEAITTLSSQVQAITPTKKRNLDDPSISPALLRQAKSPTTSHLETSHFDQLSTQTSDSDTAMSSPPRGASTAGDH